MNNNAANAITVARAEAARTAFRTCIFVSLLVVPMPNPQGGIARTGRVPRHSGTAGHVVPFQ